MQKFDFKDLFIYDLANNHQGDKEHAINIINAAGDITRELDVKAALKFQFRQLDTFIHPDYQSRTDIKYIKRFSETRIDNNTFRDLAKLIKKNGMLTMSTPFDEESVDLICDMNLDIIKIASCSADDKPLLEKVATINKPIVVSTAGLRTEEIDWLVNFFEIKGANFALMHCVALYPTPDEKLYLNQISAFTDRYKGVNIGWSTHEDQDNVSAVQIAYAKGATLFERHVGLNTEKYTLNSYSSTPEQVRRWIKSYQHCKKMIGPDERVPSSEEEKQTLSDLKRGVYVKRDIQRGETIKKEDVFFAMPVQPGQLTSGAFSDAIVANDDLKKLAPLKDYQKNHDSDSDIVFQIMLQVRGLLNKANIFINKDASIEISHHYGLKRFREFGAVIITCINRTYAKKLVIQLPRQKHPYHFHKKKEETFQLLAGDLEIVLNGEKHSLHPGDTFLVEPNSWHKFHSLDGCIFEEVSSTHFNDDSFYEDPNIAKMTREERKTNVDNWKSYLTFSHEA
jgi:sialic acid synthase SpsE/mannose-6-phosphate isomerase-like protein (cupin superfamily)